MICKTEKPTVTTPSVLPTLKRKVGYKDTEATFDGEKGNEKREKMAVDSPSLD